MYWYVSIYSEKCFWPQYMYPKLSPNNGYRWCPQGKLSHLGLEQLNTPSLKPLNKNIWNSRSLVGYMSRVNWTYGFYFLVPIRRHRKITSWPQSELYTASCWFELYGRFYGSVELSSLVGMSCIETPTSSSSKTEKFGSSATSSAILYTYDGSIHSSKVP